jgi:hypothetical protein
MLTLIVDTELLALAGDAVVLPDVVQVKEREATITLITAEHIPEHYAALRALKRQMRTLGVLLEPQWVDSDEAEALLAHYAQRPRDYRYLVVKANTQENYLGFGARWAGPITGRYRVVRVPEEHLAWQCSRLASGLQLGCSDVLDSYAAAQALIVALEARP